MCNLYSMTKSQQAIRDLVKAIRDITGNMPSLPAAGSTYMSAVASGLIPLCDLHEVRKTFLHLLQIGQVALLILDDVGSTGFQMD